MFCALWDVYKNESDINTVVGEYNQNLNIRIQALRKRMVFLNRVTVDTCYFSSLTTITV